MLLQPFSAAVLALLWCLTTATLLPKANDGYSSWARVKRDYFPAAAKGVHHFTTPQGVTIRYKMPGKEGVCETTPDVNSYAGFIDLAPDVHVFFWFFESRRDPANDDLTLCEYSAWDTATSLPSGFSDRDRKSYVSAFPERLRRSLILLSSALRA